MKLARFHLIFGILLFAAFLVTGQFMRRDFPDKSVIDQEFRILMRSRHIYILLASLSHVLLGVYFQTSAAALKRLVQYAGSVLLTAGGVLLLYAFVFETYSNHGYSQFSRNGLYIVLAGTIFHLIGGLRVQSSVDE